MDRLTALVALRFRLEARAASLPRKVISAPSELIASTRAGATSASRKIRARNPATRAARATARP